MFCFWVGAASEAMTTDSPSDGPPTIGLAHVHNTPRVLLLCPAMFNGSPSFVNRTRQPAAANAGPRSPQLDRPARACSGASVKRALCLSGARGADTGLGPVGEGECWTLSIWHLQDFII